MYQIKRNHVTEELQVEDNGETLDLRVDLNVDAIMQRYVAAARSLAEAQKEIRKGTDEDRVQKLGAAIVELFGVIFGPDQTRRLVEFYGGAYTEMLADVAPFVNDVVAPKINEAQKRIMAQYGNAKRLSK